MEEGLLRVSEETCGRTHPAYDIVVVGEMCFTGLAAVDPVRTKIDVVCQPHLYCE
jgi:hypothetical protein